jgi:hypothetical protein
MDLAKGETSAEAMAPDGREIDLDIRVDHGD